MSTMPRWVKVFGAMCIAAVLLFVALHLTGERPRLHGHAQPQPSHVGEAR